MADSGPMRGFASSEAALTHQDPLCRASPEAGSSASPCPNRCRSRSDLPSCSSGTLARENHSSRLSSHSPSSCVPRWPGQTLQTFRATLGTQSCYHHKTIKQSNKINRWCPGLFGSTSTKRILSASSMVSPFSKDSTMAAWQATPFL